MNMRLLFFNYILAICCVLCIWHVHAETNYINFDEYKEGSFPPEEVSPWSNFTNGGTTMEIVTVDGHNALEIKTDSNGGSIVCDTAKSPLKSIGLFIDKNIRMSFEFRIPEENSKQTIFLRFNTGSAELGKYFAGMALIDGRFSYLCDAHQEITNDNFQIAQDIQLETEEWYRLNFLIKALDGNEIIYTIRLERIVDPNDPIFSTEVTMVADTLSNDPVRFTLSPTSSTYIYLKNIEISSDEE